MASKWRSIGSVSSATWASVLQGTPLFAEQAAMYAAAGKHSALCLAQMQVESNLGREGIALLNSSHNVLGLRPRPDDAGPVMPGPFRLFKTYADCVRYWFDKIVDPTYRYWDTVSLEDFISVYAPSSDGNDEAWYVAAIRQAIAGWGLTDHAGDDMATFTTTIPGLPGGPLVTSYPVKLLIVPAGQTNNRPGIKARSPRRSVQHGNGNPNSTAAGEARYLFNGAEGRQASYHAASDDTEVWVMIPLDEVTWQAADGSGPGNMNGLSCEMVEDEDLWASVARRDRCIAIAADFMGRCSARLGIARPERHWDFNWVQCCSAPCDVLCGDRHHCPDKLMSLRIEGRLAWDIYAARWQTAKAAELAGSGPPSPAPPPAPLPSLVYPPGMDEGIAERLFGVIRGEDKHTYGFDPEGPISREWLRIGKSRNAFPTLTAMWNYGDGRRYFIFGNGALILWQENEAASVKVLG